MSRVCRFYTLEEENCLEGDKIVKMAVNQKEILRTVVLSRKSRRMALVALALINRMVMVIFKLDIFLI